MKRIVLKYYREVGTVSANKRADCNRRFKFYECDRFNNRSDLSAGSLNSLLIILVLYYAIASGSSFSAVCPLVGPPMSY